MSTLLAAALDYAGGNGWSVFPLWPRSKEPACKHGFKNATTNPATIRRYWLAQPEFNIGIATGLLSGIWVLDTDGTVGAETLRDLEARHGPIPATLTSLTSRGPHRWFRADSPIQSSAGRVGLGLDVRGDGGYVLAPPSVHPSGSIYTWSVDYSINALAIAPEWLVALTRKRPTISERALATTRGPLQPSGSPDAYGKAALESEITALAGTPNGQRNHALNRAAFSLFQLVAGGELDESEVLNRLVAAAHANGLMSDPKDGPASVKRAIASGRRAELLHPRCRS